jgi:hypothetical protein
VGLDAAPTFADDGSLMGVQGEVLRAVTHLANVLPSRGLVFSRLELTPARKQGHQVDVDVFRAVGCTINQTGNLEIMKSPIGDSTFTDEFATKKVAKTADVLQRIAKLSNTHAALYLLKHQGGRLNYLCRTTPHDHIRGAVGRHDEATRIALEAVVGQTMTDEQWSRAILPARLGGLGVRGYRCCADAAYVASRMMAESRITAIGPGLARGSVRPGDGRRDGSFGPNGTQLSGGLRG